MLKTFYLLACIVGTIVPWFFFGRFFFTEGGNMAQFISNLFANNPASGAAADLIISALVFWVWSFYDSRKRGIRRWWLIPVATLTVGLSLGMPLYLYQRESAKSD